jgi:hypothetical protein
LGKYTEKWAGIILPELCADCLFSEFSSLEHKKLWKYGGIIEGGSNIWQLQNKDS